MKFSLEFFGLNRFDGTSWTQYDETDGLSGDAIFAICFDNNNNLWIGTFTGNGLYKYDGTTFTTYTTADGLLDVRVRAITKDNQGNMWFGTNEGISMFNGKDFINYNEYSGLVDNRVRSLYVDNNDLWIGTWGGVSKFDLSFLEIDDYEIKNSFNIYPNPISNKIFIEGANSYKIKSVKVLNTLGKELIKAKSIEEIDFSQFKRGIYYITIIGGENNKETHKVIKK